MTPVRLEHAAPRSRVKHSTTEPLRSLWVGVWYLSLAGPIAGHLWVIIFPSWLKSDSDLYSKISQKVFAKTVTEILTWESMSGDWHLLFSCLKMKYFLWSDVIWLTPTKQLQKSCIEYIFKFSKQDLNFQPFIASWMIQIWLTAAKLTCPCNALQTSNSFARSETGVVIDSEPHLSRTCNTSFLFAPLALRWQFSQQQNRKYD